MKWSYKKATIALIVLGTLLRLFLGGVLEFGNDEVYYWLYAKFPDLSHFDHPPMVGFFIQFFTGNLYFDSELFIRLAAIIPTSINMYVVFLIGSYIKDEKVGFIAVLLYHLHIYGFIIAGTFILPDSPLVFFWLLSFYFFIQVLPQKSSKELNIKLLLAFFFAACAVYSKYQAIFLLFGIVLYIIFFSRSWLKNIWLYVGIIFPLIAVGLIFYWNYENDFISYKFHNKRVSLFSLDFNINSFMREVLGQFVYNNPYIVITFILVLISFFKKKFVFNKPIQYFFYLCSVPLILTTIYLSLYRSTLPHWSGVAYVTLLPIIALFVVEKKNIIKKLSVGIIGISVLLIVASQVINRGIMLPTDTTMQKEELGKNDVLLDMYGWEQASEKLSIIFKEHDLNQIPIISNNWYPAAHIDYYIARPNDMSVYGLGTLDRIHKYYWINKENPKLGNEALYITDGRNFKDPKDLYGDKYQNISMIKAVPIKRRGVVVKYLFLYKMSRV
ncbi:MULTISPECIES: ArnT family glycosyltransferase [unclassified Tenacibaculum]|uniref:ArnT family glycosyltransferase n=1 Tax=unclassified Tenacibaculum TaxID=2635139 RepID=UPI001F3D1991|nr:MULTISPECIES: glycosyltransferase family 39 protein [unclassified Tenacibaculum]MCF2873209.1 glycosyltransferase family 39 protein [Tenacibaculum sp. Cn5-1]MCF2933365.1 glycosyltransferase family 39 protein [Tenacibaculum sp. Cn5-34]MCG7510054.1 glycosyltransferase family 39 protein [Tenacibaculum sp. Cn5-46]